MSVAPGGGNSAARVTPDKANENSSDRCDGSSRGSPAGRRRKTDSVRTLTGVCVRPRDADELRKQRHDYIRLDQLLLAERRPRRLLRLQGDARAAHLPECSGDRRLAEVTRGLSPFPFLLPA